MKRFIGLTLSFIILSMAGQGQTSWKKIKKESIPTDYKKYTFLIEEFEYVDPEDLDTESDLSGYAIDKAGNEESSSSGLTADVNYDYEKRDLIKLEIEKTNDNLAKYNKILSTGFDSSAVKSQQSSSADIADSAKYSKDTHRYVIKHKYVYYRSTTTFQGFYIPPGYNIAFYIHDRLTGKNWPHIKIHAKDLSYTVDKIADKLGRDKK